MGSGKPTAARRPTGASRQPLGIVLKQTQKFFAWNWAFFQIERTTSVDLLCLKDTRLNDKFPIWFYPNNLFKFCKMNMKVSKLKNYIEEKRIRADYNEMFT